MSDNHAPKHIIIKKIKKVSHGHHGGAWKLAYADFVTAMMAFFLLLWLLSLLNKYQLQGISTYFKKPLKDIFDKGVETHVVAPHPAVQTIAPPNTQINKQQKQPSEQKENTNDLIHIKTKIEQELNSNPKLKEFKDQLSFEITKDGLKITLKDLEDRPMFPKGQAKFVDRAYKLLPLLSQEVNKYDNKVLIIGHTDAYQYKDNENYTNWELSADRANITRRELIRFGINSDKFIRVAGVADVSPLKNINDSLDARNRRIDIIVLTHEAAQRLINQ